MYISYEKLWTLLVARGITKSDLSEEAGISSRTIAKLTKNQSVTTDTLMHICGILHCGISDIMEVTETDPVVSVYDAFKKHGVSVGETEYFRIFEFPYRETHYRMYQTKRAADKQTFIYCEENGDLVFERESHIMTYGVSSERNVIAHVTLPTDGLVDLYVIRGRPALIKGLDEGIFLSSRNTSGKTGVYVMSEAAFRCFNL